MRAFLNDLREQPLVLDKIHYYYSEMTGKSLFQEAASLVRNRDNPLIFTGMGSSFFAAKAATSYLWSFGRQAWFFETSDLIHYGMKILTDDSCLVVISQSGESVEIKELFTRLPKNAATIGVTNQLDSSLAKSVKVCLPMLAGSEGTTASKTYTASLAVLLLLCSNLGGGDFKAAHQNLRQAIQRLFDLNETAPAIPLANIIEEFSKAKTISLVGRGPGVATALQGALTIKELVKMPAEGMEAAQFRHGPLEIADSNLAAIVIASAGQTEKHLLSLAMDLSACGVRLLTIKCGDILTDLTEKISRVDIDEYFSTLIDIYPIQLIANAVAVKLDREESFRWITKVTTRE